MPDAARALLSPQHSALIPAGVRVDSASHARARARDPFPYPSRTRSPYGVSSSRPPLYNQLEQRAVARGCLFMHKTQPKTLASTIARLVHTLLTSEPFDSLADLTDALKWRLAALRIRYTPDDISDAYRLVATARRLPGIRLPRTLRDIERAPEPGLSRAEARAILRQAKALRIRTMPAATWSDPDVDARERQAARERAWEMGVEL